VSALALTLVAASPQAPPQPPPSPVVRVTLSLVQVDAVVTDKAGHHVTDLTAADFEIFENGRLQEITHCSYVSLPKLAAPTPAPPASAGIPTPPSPPAPTRLRPERVRRTLALVVDDLGLSFRSTIEVREALKKFVDQQMEPGDLVAIVRTRGGIGALQQFTTDKAQLHAAIENVRFNAGLNRMGVDWSPAVGEGKNLVDTNAGPRGAKAPAGKTVDDLREAMLIEATIGSINFVISGLRELPGRKGVVVFSDGLRLFQDVFERQSIVDPGSRGRGGSAVRQEAPRVSSQSDPRIADAVGQLVDYANRSSVVLYTVDTRGVSTLGLSAADDVNTGLGLFDVQTADLKTHLDTRRRLSLDSEAGLQYVAQQTGGFLVRNQNDLSKAIERVVEDQRGYYLIGYAPDAATFMGPQDRPSFHKIKLGVKRPGLQVRSRAGFYGRIDEGGEGGSPAAAKPLSVVLASPFASGDIRLQLTSLFVHEPQSGYLLRSLFHVDTRDLELQDVDGALGTRLELLAVTFGDNGKVVDHLARMQEIRVAPDQLDKALQEGLTYRLDVPVKKPGAYQLRVAIRDTRTGRVGTANQLVQVPDLGEKELTLSGIVVGSVPTDGAPSDPLGTEATAALRRFRPGQALSYGFAVYNARLDKATGLPRLESQMRLFRDGQPLTTGERRPIEPANGSRMLTSGGAFVLGPEMPPGDYVLQVIVTDSLAGKKNAMVTQAVEFEVKP
jgi:VWFA-related protein